MTALVGVHGIAKQQLGRHQLRNPWARALADGMERATGHRVPVPPCDVAFYGDLFLPPTKDGAKGGDRDSVPGLADLAAAEVADLVSAASEVLAEDELAAAATVAAKGYTRVPLALQAVLRALDRRLGASAGVLFVAELRQVRRYLLDPVLKAEADARVAAAVTGDCRVLIGHSLGSVVALEFARQNPAHRLDLLLTLGSPLGLRMVRDRLPDPAYGASAGLPGNVKAWVNLRDPRDPVACAGGLKAWWPGVRDVEVNNQSDAHAVERYLSKREAGEAVLSVAPELAS
jgi:hypothetical protein